MNRDDLYTMRKNIWEREQLREMIAELENARISPRAAVYGGDRVQSTPKGDIQPENIQRIDDLLQRYNAKLRELLEAVAEFERIAECLNGQEREVLRLYFVLGRTWEEVCVEKHISWGRVMKIRRGALDVLFGEGGGGNNHGEQ